MVLYKEEVCFKGGLGLSFMWNLIKRKDVVLIFLMMPLVFGFIGSGIGQNVLEIIEIENKQLILIPYGISLLLGVIYISNVILIESNEIKDNGKGRLTIRNIGRIYLASILEIGLNILVIGGMFLVLSLSGFEGIKDIDFGVLGVYAFILALIIIALILGIIITIICMILFKFIKPINIYSYHKSSSLIDIFIVFTGCVLAFNFIGGNLATIFGEKYGYISLIFFGIIPLVYAKKINLNIKEVFSFNKPSLKYIVIGILAYIVVEFVVVLVLEGIIYIYPDMLNGLQEDNYFKGNIPLDIMVTAFMPAVFEEILCRGFIFGMLNKVSGPKVAIIVSTLLFAVMHIHPLLILNTIAAGLLCGYLVHKSKSIFVPMIVHFINNTMVILAQNFL